MNREAELHRLALADEHIAIAERAVSKQIVELEKIRGDGHDTELAEKTLQGFEKALDAMRKHREQIIKTIAQIDAGLI